MCFVPLYNQTPLLSSCHQRSLVCALVPVNHHTHTHTHTYLLFLSRRCVHCCVPSVNHCTRRTHCWWFCWWIFKISEQHCLNHRNLHMAMNWFLRMTVEHWAASRVQVHWQDVTRVHSLGCTWEPARYRTNGRQLTVLDTAVDFVVSRVT